MSIIVLPTSPLPQTATPKPVDHGGWQEPIAGGTITRLDRLGSRFAMDVALPRLKPEPDGRIWVSRLNQAIGGVARMAFPQPGLTIGSVGSPAVRSLSGITTLIGVKGFPAGYTVREGQFFNFVDTSGNRYLHHATQDQTMDGSGLGLVYFWPPFRYSPAPDDVMIFDVPTIEGRLSGNLNGWTLERAGTRGLQYTITEVR